MQVAGKLAVVTGAASGIGRATCLALADKGCDIVAVDLDTGGTDETAAEVEAMGRSSWSRSVDVADREQVFELAKWCQTDLSGADILINNAGVTVIAQFEDHSLEDFEWLMGINFWGVVYGCKAFMDQLRTGRGHIVNVSSIFGVVGVPGQSSYCSSKFAVRGFSEALRLELRDHGVGVTSVHPGGVRTQIVASARAEGDYVEQKKRSMRWFERKAMDPDRVGDAIVRSIEKNDQRLVITPEAHVLDFAQRFWPSGLGKALHWGRARLFGRT